MPKRCHPNKYWSRKERVCRGKADFVVAGRYGYHCVDVIPDPQRKPHSTVVLDTVICGVTRKEAEIIAGGLSAAQSGFHARAADREWKRRIEELKVERRTRLEG